VLTNILKNTFQAKRKRKRKEKKGEIWHLEITSPELFKNA